MEMTDQGIWGRLTLPAPSFCLSQVCIQVRARQPRSLNSELTGACSLLSPSLDFLDQVYFSNLGKDWRFSGLGQP